MRVDVTPNNVAIDPGRPAALVVSIYNDSPVIVAYRIRILGLDPAWVTIADPRPSLFPDSSSDTEVIFTLPEDAPAGTRRIGVEVTSLTEPATTEIAEVEIAVISEPEGHIELEPVSVFGTRTGTFGVATTNTGNTPLHVTFEADDPDDHLTFRFEPPTISLAPGERGFVQATARGKRPFLGSAAAHTFSVIAVDQPLVRPAIGSLVQKAWISRGAISLVGLLAAVTVFAVVLTTSLGRVVDRTRASEEALLEVIRGESAEAAVTNPATLSGNVTLLTSGTPVGGVTVDLFRADDQTRPVASTATTEMGEFTFGTLAEAAYRIRVRGAGFTEIWFPTALSFAEAEDIDVGEGETVTGLEIRLGGVPGSIQGVIIGEDPGGATVSLEVPADVIGGEVDAVVMSAVVDATGQFALEEVPAPSSYVLRVSKPGFASAVRLVNIAAGENIDGVELALRSGDGSISGMVVDNSGPVGGATIVATAGQVEARTASLTQAAVGSFTLRDLPTPATYTLQVTAEGYATETFSLRLDTAQQVGDLQVQLRSASGSIGGTVAIVGQGPIGDVLVTVSDGAAQWSTKTLSVGAVGSYLVADLPLPGTYTVTFSRAGLATQIRSVDLDAFGNGNRSDVDANLNLADAVIGGTITDQASNPLGGVRVTATRGDLSLVTTSAHEPAGRYELRDLPAGTYTLTFERPGSQPTAVLVALRAAEVRTLDVTLEPQASVRGQVTVGGVATGGLQVRLFLVEQYPSTILTTTITAADGTYVFEALDAPQTYVIEFLNPGGAVVGTRTITLLAGEQRTGVDFAIP